MVGTGGSPNRVESSEEKRIKGRVDADERGQCVSPVFVECTDIRLEIGGISECNLRKAKRHAGPAEHKGGHEEEKKRELAESPPSKPSRPEPGR